MSEPGARVGAEEGAQRRPTSRIAREQFYMSSWKGLSTLSLVLCAIFLFITPYNWFEFSADVRGPLIASDLLNIVAFAGLWQFTRRASFTLKRSVASIFLVEGLLLQNILLAHSMRPSLVYFGYIVIIAMGVGAVAISRRFALSFLAVIWGATVPVLLLTVPSGELSHVLTALFAASAVTMIIQKHNSRLITEGEYRLTAERALRKANKRLDELIHLDPLTELGNRRFLTVTLEACCEVSGALSVAIIDLDGFKNLNDTHGHQRGDRFLRQVASALSDATRGDDAVGRWGGDEFMVILPGTQLDEAEHVARRVVQRIAGIGEELDDAPVTASVGVAERLRDEDLESLLYRADMASYEAKSKGGDQYVLASDHAPSRARL